VCGGLHQGAPRQLDERQACRTVGDVAGELRIPRVRALPVSDADTDLVVKVLRPIWDIKTETAVRLPGRIESIIDWATVSEYRVGENPARWRGHLENLLANPNKIAPVTNFPALPWPEIATFVALLVQREGAAALAVQFAILTACRSGEVRGATWSEIDGDAKVWTIPAKRMKVGKEHQVPLSPAAIAVLGQMPPDGAFIFSGRSHDTPLCLSSGRLARKADPSDADVGGVLHVPSCAYLLSRRCYEFVSVTDFRPAFPWRDIPSIRHPVRNHNLP
jgi:integrase